MNTYNIILTRTIVHDDTQYDTKAWMDTIWTGTLKDLPSPLKLKKLIKRHTYWAFQSKIRIKTKLLKRLLNDFKKESSNTDTHSPFAQISEPEISSEHIHIIPSHQNYTESYELEFVLSKEGQ